MIYDRPINHDLTTKSEKPINDEESTCCFDETKKIILNYLGQKRFLANNKKAMWNVLCTIAFHLFALATYFTMHSSFLFCITYSFAIVRWFVIFHDCIHLSFWENPTWCIYFGQLLSIIVMTPYTSWHNNHVLHHEISGDRTNTKHAYNDTIYFTVREYLQLPHWKRYLYRFFRDPVMFFTIMPFIKFFFVNRFRKGAWVTNVGTFVYCYFFYYCGGFKLLLLFLLTVMFFGSMGFMLFHLQHTYNPSYLNNNPGQYSKFESAIHGSSYIIMPLLIKWFFMGVEYHQIHHLRTRIPAYNLEQAHNDAPPYFWKQCYKFDSWNKIIDSLRKTLFDEDRNRFIGFSEVPKQ